MSLLFLPAIAAACGLLAALGESLPDRATRQANRLAHLPEPRRRSLFWEWW